MRYDIITTGAEPTNTDPTSLPGLREGARYALHPSPSARMDCTARAEPKSGRAIGVVVGVRVVY